MTYSASGGATSTLTKRSLPFYRESPSRRDLKTDVSPMYLTYHMVRWEEVEQAESEQRCQTCGAPLKRTEEVVDGGGNRYEGYVCHRDRQVTWVKTGRSR